MSEPLTYARVPGDGREGVPENYWNVEVIDLDTGAKLKGVIEVNSAEGWLVRTRYTPAGDLIVDGDRVATERIAGRFELRLRVETE